MLNTNCRCKFQIYENLIFGIYNYVLFINPEKECLYYTPFQLTKKALVNARPPQIKEWPNIT